MNIAQLHWKKKLGLFLMVLGFSIGIAIFGWKINVSWWMVGYMILLGFINLISDHSVDNSEGNFPFWSKK